MKTYTSSYTPHCPVYCLIFTVGPGWAARASRGERASRAQMVGTCGFYPVRGGIRHRVLRRSVYGRSGTSSGGISAQLAVGCQLEGEVSADVLTDNEGRCGQSLPP
ncbi:uncharacterized protein LOC144882554 [Branchiostoma floridae x Branchiostoma japonicum]